MQVNKMLPRKNNSFYPNVTTLRSGILCCRKFVCLSSVL